MWRATLVRTRSFVLAVVLAIAVAGIGIQDVVAAPSTGSRMAGSHTSSSGYCPSSEELAFLALINDYRADNGRRPLGISKRLGASAEHHSRDMAYANYFSHSMANGSSWADNIRAHGYKGSPIGENIAAGYRSASSTFNQWVNSAGHRANMLNPNYTAIGIGLVGGRSSTYRYYWTTTFGGSFDSSPSCL